MEGRRYLNRRIYAAQVGLRVSVRLGFMDHHLTAVDRHVHVRDREARVKEAAAGYRGNAGIFAVVAVVVGVGACAVASTASALRSPKCLEAAKIHFFFLYWRGQWGGGDASMRPVIDPKPRHPFEFANIVGNEHQALATRMRRDQHIVGPAGPANSGQLGPYLPEMRRGFRRKRQHLQPGRELFDRLKVMAPAR